MTCESCGLFVVSEEEDRTAQKSAFRRAGNSSPTVLVHGKIVVFWCSSVLKATIFTPALYRCCGHSYFSVYEVRKPAESLHMKART